MSSKINRSPEQVAMNVDLAKSLSSSTLSFMLLSVKRKSRGDKTMDSSTTIKSKLDQVHDYEATRRTLPRVITDRRFPPARVLSRIDTNRDTPDRLCTTELRDSDGNLAGQ